MESKTVDSHINWAEEGGVLEERNSMIGMRVHDGRARKIENNEPGHSCTGTRSYLETEGHYQPIIFKIEDMIDRRTMTKTNPFLLEIARTTCVGRNNNEHSQKKT